MKRDRKEAVVEWRMNSSVLSESPLSQNTRHSDSSLRTDVDFYSLPALDASPHNDHSLINSFLGWEKILGILEWHYFYLIRQGLRVHG